METNLAALRSAAQAGLMSTMRTRAVRSADKHCGKPNSGMNDVCRLCLAKGKRMQAIFEDDEESMIVRGLIIECCPVQLTQHDILPRFICKKCRTKLTAAHNFREQCRQSEERLRRSYAKLFGFAKDGPAHDSQDNSSATEVLSNATSDPDATESQTSLHRKVTVESETEKNSTGKCDKAKDNRNRRKRSNYEPKERKRKEGKRKKIDGAATENNDESNQRLSLEGNEKQYLCDICSKTFVTRSGLQYHLRTHTGNKPYSCRFCDKRFMIPSYRLRHERTHAGDKPYVCHVCSAAFASRNGLMYHLRVHTGEANYHCDTCGKSFRRYKYLKEHIFTHTGERPFACKICGSAYGSSGSLFVHEKKCKAKQMGTAVLNSANQS